MKTENGHLQVGPESRILDLLILIADPDSEFRKHAMAELGGIGDEQIFPVLEAALRANDNADLRNGAMELFVLRDTASVPRLVRLLGDLDEEVRNFSTVMLGRIGSRDAVSPLMAALKDPDVNVRHGAAEALGNIGDAAAVESLVALLDEELWLRHAAIVALGAIADIRALPHLVRLRNDEMFGDMVSETITSIWSRLHSGIYCSSGC